MHFEPDLNTLQLCVRALLAPADRAQLMANFPMQVLNTCRALVHGVDGAGPYRYNIDTSSSYSETALYARFHAFI